MKHMMIDIETLGTSNDAMILEVGYVIFEVRHFDRRQLGIISCKSIPFNMTDQLEKYDREVNESTLQWWKSRGDSRLAIAESFLEDSCDLDKMVELQKEAADCETVWSNGLTFDPVILQHYANQLGLIDPLWHFSKNRDLRTIRRMFDGIVPKTVDNSTPNNHRALSDALNQLVWLSSVVEHLYHDHQIAVSL